MPLRIFRIFFGLLPLLALLRQLVIHVTLAHDWVNFFSYYTNLSNLFAGCVLLLSATPTQVPNRPLEILRVVAVINMTLVGILFTLLLRDTELGSLLPWVNVVHHYLMPCIVLIDWIIMPPRIHLGWRELALSLTFPLVYVVYALVRGALIGWYPYPFLNPAMVGGAPGVAQYVLGMTLGFILVGWTLIAVGNRRRRNALKLSA